MSLDKPDYVSKKVDPYIDIYISEIDWVVNLSIYFRGNLGLIYLISDKKRATNSTSNYIITFLTWSAAYAGVKLLRIKYGCPYCYVPSRR